ncbi:unnamed protein product [Albugo candida]|uniref:Uncharacterized protein n=1 Tax=Albugo candida TaxID=65357 RepID=A0A024FX20_9STRA|nr:unnamed protein product [Albugo candida]|eukprot:CCI11209.1 unnamed protein product [Albugo candida]
MDRNAVFVQIEWSHDSQNGAHRNVCIWDTECGYPNCNLSFQAMCSPDHCRRLMTVFRYLEMDFANNPDFGVKRSPKTLFLVCSYRLHFIRIGSPKEVILDIE